MASNIDRRTLILSTPALVFSLLLGGRTRAGEIPSADVPRSPFGTTSTAEQVTRGVDLAGKTALITGSNSGIGLETLRVLVLRGARVLAVARTNEKASTACAAVLTKGVKGDAIPFACEQTDFASVVACADEVQRFGAPIDALICNAGVNLIKLEQVNGIEKDFVVNHLSHFILVNRLLNLVRAAPQGRIVVVGSGAHYLAPATGIEFDNLSGQRGYDFMKMYAQSKLANGLFVRELAHRLSCTTVTANVVDPGLVDTKMNRNLLKNGVMPAYVDYKTAKTVAQGAATTCYVATNPALSKVNGSYFADCNVATPRPDMWSDALAARLWTVSEDLTHPYLRSDGEHTPCAGRATTSFWGVVP